MANVLERARSRRMELMSEVQRLDAFLAMYEALEGAEDTTPIRIPEVTPATGNSVPEAAVRRGPNGSSPDQIVDAATAAIIEAGRPMTRYELVSAVEAMGLTVGGVDKARNMGTILWRSRKFKNAGEGYWPADMEQPEPGGFFDPDGSEE